MTTRKAKPTEVTAPVIPADEAFGNAIISLRDAADAEGSRLHNALVNCEAVYDRELTRVNAAYQAERASLQSQIAQHERILNAADQALECLKFEGSNIVPLKAAE